MKKFFKGFVFAFKGIRYTFNTQVNFRVQCFLAVFIIAFCFYLKISVTEWLWILGAVAIVLMAELGNTAIESLVDLVCPEYNIKAGIVKDIMAGIVVIAALTALCIGVLILLPKIIHAT